MVITHRRRLTPGERKHELLDAAVRVLREREPGECRVEDVTTAAGTAKGNFYRYFPAWDDLLVAVRDHLVDAYADELRRRFASHDAVDWWTRFADEIDRFVDFHLDLGPLHDVLFHGPASRARPVAGGRSAVSVIAALLYAGVADNAFAPVDVEATAALFFHLFHGAADEIADGGNRAAIRDAVLHIVKRTLEPGGGTS